MSFAMLTLGLGATPLAVAAQGPGGATRLIPVAGASQPQTGEYSPSGSNDATQVEFPGQMDTEEGPGPYPGTIVNRSLSKGNGHGAAMTGSAKAKSNPTFVNGFEGLNLYQQRYARGGNQFTVEPPDQGMCVGNGYVVEAVNDVLNVFDTSGASVLPDNTATNIVSGLPRDVHHAVDLNSFFGYAPAIDRTTGVRAQFVTDPSCLYDAATQRFFVVVLTLETNPNGSFTLENHLDLAVSQTPDPTGMWTIYRVDVTNDGTSNPDPGNACPCLGDYPHIGADKNGFYITTNAYPWNGNGFNGAQIYAFSKDQLAAGAWGIVPGGQGAAAVDGNSIWIAGEYVSQACDYTAWGGPYFGGSGDNLLGACSGAPGAPRQLFLWVRAVFFQFTSTSRGARHPSVV